MITASEQLSKESSLSQVIASGLSNTSTINHKVSPIEQQCYRPFSFLSPIKKRERKN